VKVDWYFDFASPLCYVCLARLRELPKGTQVVCRPIRLEAASLRQGRRTTDKTHERYARRWSLWRAARLDLPLRFPSRHPFDSTPHLRLAIAAGGTSEAVAHIFEHLWTGGADPEDQVRFAELCRAFGLDQVRIAVPEVRDALRRNCGTAASLGIFDAPAFAVEREIFCGVEAVEFVSAFIADPKVVAAEMSLT
jgi:2-hydroxychromene-2-carboxylate isomerase